MQCERNRNRFHSRYVTLMVGPPDVNNPVELALYELVVVIGNIGGKVGG